MNVHSLYYILLLLPSVTLAQRRMVVVNVESKVLVRDVVVSADGGQEMRTTWDGLFALPDSFLRLDFRHPDFERRYVLCSEIKGDTIFLISNMNALREVVIYGERRFDKRIAQMLRPSPQQQERDKLPQVIPAGPNVLAIAGSGALVIWQDLARSGSLFLVQPVIEEIVINEVFTIDV